MEDKMDYWDGENWLTVEKNNNFERHYYTRKLQHNKKTPREFFFKIDGTIAKEYYLNGDLHRKDGPAVINYYINNNVIVSEIYIQYGNFHRKDGPAFVFYNNDGNIFNKNYFFNGKEYKPEKLPFKLPIDSEEKRLFIEL